MILLIKGYAICDRCCKEKLVTNTDLEETIVSIPEKWEYVDAYPTTKNSKKKLACRQCKEILNDLATGFWKNKSVELSKEKTDEGDNGE